MIKIEFEEDKFFKTRSSLNLSNLAATYVPTNAICSIIGDEALDFQVRNGAGYCFLSITTKKREIKVIDILD